MTSPVVAFRDWALRPTGFDGGNPKAGFWICGIEHSGPENCIIPSRDLQRCWSEPGSWPASDEPHCIGPSNGSDQYNRFVARLVAELKGLEHDAWQRIRPNLFDREGHCFKMNLFPLQMPTTKGPWRPELTEFTGFRSLADYRAWCIEQRFPRLRDAVATMQPRAIIATGAAAESREWFRSAFAESNHLPLFGKFGAREGEVFGPIDGPGRTKVFIVPFLGRGHMSNAQSGAIGIAIREALG